MHEQTRRTHTYFSTIVGTVTSGRAYRFSNNKAAMVVDWKEVQVESAEEKRRWKLSQEA